MRSALLSSVLLLALAAGCSVDTSYCDDASYAIGDEVTESSTMALAGTWSLHRFVDNCNSPPCADRNEATASIELHTDHSLSMDWSVVTPSTGCSLGSARVLGRWTANANEIVLSVPVHDMTTEPEDCTTLTPPTISDACGSRSPTFPCEYFYFTSDMANGLACGRYRRDGDTVTITIDRGFPNGEREMVWQRLP